MRTAYVLQRWTGMWTDEGIEFDNLEEAKNELAFYKKFMPQEKWRIKAEARTIIWKEGNDYGKR